MGVFSDNPVLGREMRGRLRLRRKGAGRPHVWIIGVLVLVIFYYYVLGFTNMFYGPPQDARDLWPLLSYGLLTLIVLIAPALTASAITQEREQQTWDSLASTRLTGGEVLLGKWLARQTVPAVLIALACPYLLGCASHGQMGLPMFPATLAFLLVTSLFYGALGLLCSYLAKRTAAATATALVFSALLCLGTPVISSVIAMLDGPRSTPILWFNPYYALTALLSWLGGENSFYGNYHFYDSNLAITLFYLIAMSLLTAAALLFMVRRYRQAVRGQG